MMYNLCCHILLCNDASRVRWLLLAITGVRSLLQSALANSSHTIRKCGAQIPESWLILS